ncbi:MAG: SpoIIE family protein phosphatase [Ignavibacteriales bacterium]|nr:SpoIIE family protein phosphatase [Ignavibacteriales bacterium]
MSQNSNLQEENQQLRKAIEELSLLNELSRVINSTISLDVVIENIIKKSVKAIHANQGMITLIDEINPNSMFTFIRSVDSGLNHKQFHLNQNILGWMMIHKTPLVANKFQSDPRFIGIKTEEKIESLLCSPLLVKNRLIGILAVFDKNGNGEFTSDDTRLLTIIASQSAQVLENARLYEQEKNKQALEKEFVAAREVQMSLLPKQLPEIKNFELAAATIPAKEVGGDFYDIIKINDSLFEIILADVSGKGLSAALLATLGKGILCSQVMQHRSALTQLEQSNTILRGSIQRKSFITLLLAVVRPDDGSVSIFNVGHCYPILYTAENDTIEMLSVKGTALNLTDKIKCEERLIMMKKNDCLLIYSDGVSEAQNLTMEFFGEERILNLLKNNANQKAETIVQKINDEVKLFCKGVSQTDDITMVVLKAVA